MEKIIRNKKGQFIKSSLPWNTGTKGLVIGYWKGKKFSDEYKKKLSEAHKDKKLSVEHKMNIKNSSPKGKNHYLWKGNNVGYVPLHIWVKRCLGKPKHCNYCKTTTAKKFEWANINHKYRRNLNDFVELCTSCHRLYDYGKIKLKNAKIKCYN